MPSEVSPSSGKYRDAQLPMSIMECGKPPVINLGIAVVHHYDSTYTTDTILHKVDFGKIYFNPGRTNLDRQARKLLDTVALKIRQHGYGRPHLVLTGHTDSTGKEEDNMKLSFARSAAVEEYLKSREVAIPFTSLGYASSVPVERNDSSKGRRKNRRVEIELIWYEVKHIKKAEKK